MTAGGSLRSYCYDANGNLTTITGANAGYTTVSWWAANLARRMSKGSTSAEFWYGPDRARVLQVATRATESERTVYLGSLYERTVITPNTGSATTRHVHYVRAGDETLAIKIWSKVGTGAYSPQVRYPHRDHLGSVVAITTETGTVESRSSFDVWGKRRDPATWVTPAPGTFTAAPTATDRGYTGHEHVDELGLVHMNGRIYDPEIGKFLSADPTLQFPESTQGYNRYAYAGNNPLTFTDPSGFSFWKSLMKVVGVFLSYLPLPTNLFLRVLWQFVVGSLASGGSVTAGLNRVTNGLYGRIRDSGNSARGPPNSSVLITNLTPGRSGAESPEKDADWQQITESIRWHLGTAQLADASEATNTERKSAAGRATETGSFAYLLPLAPAAEVAVSFIPVVGTAVALYAVYVAYSDPDATNEDRVFALVGIAPFGKIAGLLAHSKIVVAAIKVAEKGGAKAARGAAQLGRAGEAAAGIVKNTERIASASGTAAYRVPDVLNHSARVIGEVKNVGSLSYTSQLRDFVSYASSNGYRFELWVRPTTQLSGPLQQAVSSGDVVLRFLP